MTDFYQAQRTLEARGAVEPWTPDDAPSIWTDTVASAFAQVRREELSSSAGAAWQTINRRRADEIAKLGGDRQAAEFYANIPAGQLAELRRAALDGDVETSSVWRTMSETARDAWQLVDQYQREYPELVHSDEALFETFKGEAAELRASEQYILDRGSGMAAFLGSAGGIMTDPLILASLPFGATLGGTRAAGMSLWQVAGRTAAIEGSIAAGVEIPIQAQVHQFKRDLESPWSWQNSALNVVAAGVGGAAVGGALGAGVEGVRRTLARYNEAKAAGTARVTPDTEDAADALQQTVDLHEQNPLQGPGREAAHEQAFDTARAQSERHEPVRVEDIIGEAEPTTPIRRAIREIENPSALIDLDPTTVRIDAETFQFKAGGDAHGVTDALRGLETFDRVRAGVVLVWENINAERYIADGHQRVGLANRALAAGQDPAEVRLNAIVLREADGISAADARRIAATKNMAEGTGSAVDAAKILREVGDMADLALPPLPPRSALVRQARGLAQLDDEAFRQVINEVIPEAFGALVGQSTPDPQLQQAMIEILRRVRPANETQARAIVDQVRTQGVEVRTTEDLFGEQSFAESLYLERAQLLDQVLREARADKATFGKLISEADRIEEAGSNVLDRATNLERIQEAKDAATQISRLANARGPISDALSDGARRLKAGERANAVAADILETIRAELRGRPGTGPEPGAARPAGEAAPVERPGPAPIDEALDPDAANFGIRVQHTVPDSDPRLQPTHLIDTPERQALRQRIIDKHFEGKASPKRKAGQRPVAYLMAGGGASGKGTVKGWLREVGDLPPGNRVVDIDPDEIKVDLPEYGSLLRDKDMRAASVVHEESSSLAARVLERAQAERYDIVSDRTLSDLGKATAELEALKAAGYEIRIVGVTVDPDEAMRRMVMRANKSGRFLPTSVMLAAHRGFTRAIHALARLADDLILFDNNQALGHPPRLVATKQGDGLAIEDSFLYNRFVAKGEINGQETTLRQLAQRVESAGPEGAAGAGRMGASRTQEAAGRARSAGRHTLDDFDPAEVDATLAQARQLIEDQGDLIQVARIEADELGQQLTATRPARELLQELDELEHTYRGIELCAFPGGRR